MRMSPWVVSRRRLLQAIPAGAAAVGAAALAGERSLQAVTRAAQAGGTEEAFWRSVRGEFLLDKDWTYLNNGTLGPTPKPSITRWPSATTTWPRIPGSPTPTRATWRRTSAARPRPSWARTWTRSRSSATPPRA